MAINKPRQHTHKCLSFITLLFVFSMFIWSFSSLGECKELFEIQSFVVEGKTLALVPSNMEGKGLAQVIVISKTGIYPSEQRWISIFSTGETLKYDSKPIQKWKVDHDATMFEVGDVAPTPGKEIFFLTSTGIRYYARDNNGFFSTLSRSLLNIPTATVFPSAGLLPRSGLLADWQQNEQQMILVPQFGAFVFYNRNEKDGWYAAERIPTVPRTFLHGDQEDDGILRSFSMRMDYRLPRIFSQDFNGDGQRDLLITEQEFIWVYLQDSNGHFPQKADVDIQLPGRGKEKEHDWDFSFLTVPAEINGDGFTDVILIFSSGTGGFLERKVEVRIFLNQKIPGKPFPDHPDQTLTFKGITPGICVADINNDGLQDIMFSYIKLGFWNTVKNLISKQVDVNTSVYIMQNNHRFSVEPEFHNRTKYKLDLTHGIQFNGIWPSLEGDFDGDGYPDLLIANDGKLKIYQTLQDNAFFSNLYHQADVITCPLKQIIDLNQDGLDDIVFYEKKQNGTVFVLLNKGKLKTSFQGKNKTLYEER
jgi:hypothetical protein